MTEIEEAVKEHATIAIITSRVESELGKDLDGNISNKMLQI